MNKHFGLLLGAVLVSAVAVLLINRERAETKRRQKMMESLRSQSDNVARLTAENSRLSKMVTQTSRPIDNSTNEILRLRGEIGRLRRELGDARLTAGRDVARGQETSNSLVDEFTVKEVDMDTVVNAPIGATANDVLSELQRIGAQLVFQEPGFIVGGIGIPTTNLDLSPGVTMRFYFDADRLSSKEYLRLPR